MGKSWELMAFLLSFVPQVHAHRSGNGKLHSCQIMVVMAKFRDTADRYLRGTFWKQDSHRRG